MIYRLIIALLLAASMFGQVAVIGLNDQVSASRATLNANFAYLDSKMIIGTGSPVGNVPCSASQNSGFIFVRTDGGASNLALFACVQKTVGGWAWDGPYGAGSGGGGTGDMLRALNLSDLTSASTARTNLGLGTAATFASTAFESAIASGNASQYWRGDKTWQSLTTAAVPEIGNLYFTAARVYAALGGASLNAVPVGNGSSYTLVTLPACNGIADKLLYSQAGGFTCGIDLNSGGGGGGTWGSIAGTLSAQTDLAAALAAKAPLASPSFSGVPTVPTAAANTNTTQIASTAYVDGALSVKAPLASPSFSGVPTVPTATPGTNTTQAASTAYVDAGLTLKANLGSPALTGIPTAPTASVGTNTTQIATTAFVAASTLGGVTGDEGKVAMWTSAGAVLRNATWMAPFQASNAPSAITPGQCTTRDTVWGGSFDSIEFHSIDGSGANLSGTFTLTFSASTDGGSTWTTLGTAGLSSSARTVDTLSGWATKAVAAGSGSKVRACITAASTVQTVVISPRFFILN